MSEQEPAVETHMLIRAGETRWRKRGSGSKRPHKDAANPTFAATAAGTFTLTLAVTDGHGGTATDDVVITVEEAATAP